VGWGRAIQEALGDDAEKLYDEAMKLPPSERFYG
jgi:hypothetical protein